ncbi:hypothetical protein SFRURICE_005758 [Spodoptera frugiperda]|nr:hypothetical protein SFRURICE_005758 [Spodoptera frugiperda]
MLITKYTAILLESARSTEARNMAVSRSDAWSSSLDSSTGGRRPVRRRHFVYSIQFLKCIESKEKNKGLTMFYK